jgi:hypothetical protein
MSSFCTCSCEIVGSCCYMLPDTSCHRYFVVTVAQVPKRGGSQSTKLLQSNYGTGTVVNRSMLSRWLNSCVHQQR